MKFLSQLTTMVSGSINGLVGSHNRGGQYFRARVVPTDPSSPAQSSVRSLMAYLSDAWVNILTPTERLSWATYADNVTWTDVLGQSIKLSGINHFIRSNLPRLLNDAYNDEGFTATVATPAPVYTAPTIYDLSEAPVILGATIEVAGAVVTATIPGGVRAATADLLVYLSAPQNPSINYHKGPYYFVGSAVGTDSTPTAVTADLASIAATPWAGRFTKPIVGQRVFGLARWTNDDGRLSGETRFMVTVTAGT